MCACVPLVWLTQPAAASQGCCGRAVDLHPPPGQIGSLLARNPKIGKAIDAVRRVAVSAAGGLVRYVIARFWRGEGQSTKLAIS